MGEAPGLGKTPARGMGRGLAAILPRTNDAVEGLRDLPLDLVKPNERQPRREFDEGALQALADSVKTRGVLQPIVVRPRPGGRYELVAGERRVRAARIAGLETVPALVRAADDWERLDLALAENMAREDLNAVEEARACALLVDDLGLSKGEVGRRVGRSRVAISNLVRLLELPEPVLELIEAGELSEGHGRAILTCKDHEARKRLGRDARAGGWSVRETERRARGANHANGDGGHQVVIHPDLAQAVAVAEDALAAALGCELTVRPRGQGCRLQIDFAKPADAVTLAERVLGREAVSSDG